MAEEERQFRKRNHAVKVSIRDLVTGSFIKENDTQLIHLRTIYGESIARANIIGGVLTKDSSPSNQSLILDDGSGKILVRSFDSATIFDKINVGEVVLAIGKPREFNNEHYLSVEIIKKLDLRWMNVRRLELQKKVLEVVKQKKNDGEVVSDFSNVKRNLIELIRSVDKGQGVEVAEIMRKFENEDIKEELDYLIKRGEVFEVVPGVLKVLE